MSGTAFLGDGAERCWHKRAGERDEFVQVRVRFHRWFVCADLSAILSCLLCVSYRTLGQCQGLSRCAFLMEYPNPSLRVFSFSGAVRKVRKIGSAGDFH